MGGAQRLLEALVSGLAQPDFEHVVVCLGVETKLSADLRELGHSVHCLGLNILSGLFLGLYSTLRLLRDYEGVSVVHTWLYHGDLVGGLAAALSGSRPIVWSVHHASLDLRHEKYMTRILVKALSVLSRKIPDVVVYCSDYARAVHEALGYSPSEGVVVENGVDTDRFCPSESARRAFRRENHIPDYMPVVGIVARNVSIKGVDVFLRMAAKLDHRFENICYVMAGTGMTRENAELVDKIEEAGLGGKIKLLGERSDIEKVMNGLDILVCPSFSESFGLVVAEALACGVPVVASEISVLEAIVGSNWTARIGDSSFFSEKVSELLGLPIEARTLIGKEGRDRVLQKWSVNTMLAGYSSLYRRIATSSIGR